MTENIKSGNKTYEEYFEQIKPDIYAKEGEEITCQNGHFITKFRCTCYIADEMMALDIENGSKNCRKDDTLSCIICSRTYIRKVGDPHDRYGTVFQFWMDGQWRERKFT